MAGRSGDFVIKLLDTLVLQPLMQIYGALFESMPEALGAGPRLMVFSVIVNILLLPLYLEMERSSRRLRELRERVDRDVARMRRHFRGRERYFYVRAVHRQHGYRPISALLGSGDLFIQIVVFATAYRYLIDLDAVRGRAFGPIVDLGLPDGLIGGANLLPFVMTAINAASVLAYVQDRRRRTQALALAAFFLALLYASPSGLVLYWTTNNLFSYARNVVGRSPRLRLPGGLARAAAVIARQQ